MEISIALYRDLLYSQAKLQALEAGGVEDWEWYDEAMSNDEYKKDLLGILEELGGLYDTERKFNTEE